MIIDTNSIRILPYLRLSRYGVLLYRLHAIFTTHSVKPFQAQEQEHGRTSVDSRGHAIKTTATRGMLHKST